MAEIEIRETSEQPCLYIKATCSHQDIGNTLQRLLPLTYAHAIASGARPGPPFARYVTWRESDCDFEAGVPTDRAIEGADEILSGTLGGGKAAFTIHTGCYSGLSDTHMQVWEFVKKNNHEMNGHQYEIYVDDPGEVPTEEVRTEVYWPVA